MIISRPGPRRGTRTMLAARWARRVIEAEDAAIGLDLLADYDAPLSAPPEFLAELADPP